MQSWITYVMNRFGYFGILFLIFIENVFPPIPSEVILSFGGFATTLPGATMSKIGVIVFATLGSVLGAVVLYYIGTLISVDKLQVWLENKKVQRLGFKKDEVMKTVDFFDKYRSKAVLFGRCVPIIRSLISIPAGMTKMNMPKFVGLTFIGSLVWNVILVLLGAKMGENWPTIANFVDQYSKIVAIIIVIIFIVYIVNKVAKKRKRK